ncbi:MAG: hypothetical protein KC478_10050 [Bacteriovoracaceae bacterium]|nr:hypothetical protein [Bacteriovoracaceae bacterium]
MKKVIALILASTTLGAFGMNMEEFNEKSYISYFGEYNKGTIGESSSRAFYYQSISGRYKLNNKWTARLDLRMETKEAEDDPYTELNPRLGVQGITYVNGNFSVFTQARLEVAAVSSSLDVNKIVKPKFYNAVNYSMGAQSFSVGMEVAKWLYESGKENLNNDPDYDKLNLFADVTYRYTIDAKKTFQIYYELGLDARGTETNDLTNTFERFLIGMDLSVADSLLNNTIKGVTLFPHIDYRPQNSTDTELKDLGLGLWVSATVF